MTKQLKNMSGDEFVTKVLAGERDFRRIRLEPGYNLTAHERYGEFKTYLSRLDDDIDDMKEYPLNLIDSIFANMKTGELPLAYIRAAGTSFRGSDFAGCGFIGVDFERAGLDDTNLSYSNWVGASLKGASLRNANLYRSTFTNVDLRSADLDGARLGSANLFWETNLDGANLARAVLENADLTDAKNLQHTVGLSSAHFLKTRISRDDASFCKKSLQRDYLIYKGIFNGFFDD